MYKKLASCALLMATSGVFAGTMGPVVEESGYSFFIGGAAGIGMLQGEYRGYDPLSADTHYARLGNDNFLGGGLLGIQTVFPNQVYLALVANALYNSQDDIQRLSKAPASAPIPNHVVNIENDFQYGLNVRLGRRLDNVTPYILGGVEAGKWEMSLGNQSALWNRGIAPFSNREYSKTKAGGQVGAGALINLTSEWTIGMEYAHTWFNDVSVNLTDATTLHTWNHKAKIQQDQVLFSVNYVFNM